jgi:two-component system, OmpR family, KDP operon response regulator KdpE
MKPTILVVEDELDMFRALAVRLEANGFRALLATSVATAVGMVRLDPPDLIVLDLGLPDGDGYTVMEKLKSLPTPWPIPVIVLTARDPQGNQERSYESGAYDFFQKPVNEEWLVESIRRALTETAPKVATKPISEV